MHTCRCVSVYVGRSKQHGFVSGTQGAGGEGEAGVPWISGTQPLWTHVAAQFPRHGALLGAAWVFFPPTATCSRVQLAWPLAPLCHLPTPPDIHFEPFTLQWETKELGSVAA